MGEDDPHGQDVGTVMGRRGSVVVLAVGLAVALVGAACSGDDDSKADDAAGAPPDQPAEVVDPYDGHTSEIYGDTANWICHPDKTDDSCRDLSATAIAADGSQERADLQVAEDPPIDCFYVYPTTSQDPGPVSDLNVDESELSTVRAQAAPFASSCRVFAPAYRQVTISAIFSGGFSDGTSIETAHADVVDAWKTYISQYNEGRGVVLIGHSQGTGHLDGLIADEIVDTPALKDRFVSAILLGGDTTGFDGIPACEEAGQTGCVIAYDSFPKAAPPAEGSFFGNVGADGTRTLCVDPTELTGDELSDAIVPTGDSLLGGVDLGVEVSTRYIVLPDALDLSCESTDAFDYLAVAPASAAGGDTRHLDALTNEALGPTWGLHLMDANVGMGQLLEIVAAQGKSFSAPG
jgi:pimeloyl-ACP methyl ester carboxylesterase